MKKNQIFSIALSLFMGAFAVCASACGGDGTGGTGGNTGATFTWDGPLDTGLRTLNDSSVELCNNGQTGYKVVLEEDASAAEQWAANELITWVERSTGATLPLINDSALDNASTQEKYISIGDTALFDDSGITVTQTEVTTDGYKIVKKDNTVYICGPTDWGTTFGVFEFLRLQVGYEAYTNDEIYYDKHTRLMVKDYGTYVDVPAFETRYMDGIANHDFSTSYRLRTVSVYGDGEARYGGNKKKNWIPGSDHTILQILPEDKYQSWYQPGKQLCFSDQKIIGEIIENLKAHILANPDGYIVMIGQEDGKGFCDCSVCAEERELYKTSGYFVRFMNKVVTALEEWKNNGGDDGTNEALKQRYLIYSFFAYGDTSKPPVVEDENGNYSIINESCRPHEKLYVKVARNACPLHELTDPTCTDNRMIYKEFLGWNAICPRLFVWNYAADYQCYLPMYNDFDHMKTSYQFFKQMGAIDMFTEMNSGGSITMFGWLRMYLRGKLMWNPNQDLSALIDNFFGCFYKDIAPIMRQVFDLYRTHQRALDASMAAEGGKHRVTINIDLWPRHVVDNAEALLRQALKACENIKDDATAEKLMARVEEELVCLQLLQVLFYKQYEYDMNNYQAFIAAFEQKTIEMNITKYREHESMADFLARLK